MADKNLEDELRNIKLKIFSLSNNPNKVTDKTRKLDSTQKRIDELLKEAERILEEAKKESGRILKKAKKENKRTLEGTKTKTSFVSNNTNYKTESIDNKVIEVNSVRMLRNLNRSRNDFIIKRGTYKLSYFDNNLEFNGSVTIEPGTKIYSENEIIFKGKVTAKGTYDDKIVFSSEDRWEGLVIKGIDSDNSIFENCEITNVRSSGNHGAIRVIDSSPKFIKTTISYNRSELRGGGIYFENSKSKIINCEISYNEASKGGGIYASRSAITIDNCNIHNNNASEGGGIYLTKSDFTKIILNDIENNKSLRSGSERDAGGIQNDSSNSIIQNNKIKYNGFTGVSVTQSEGITIIENHIIGHEIGVFSWSKEISDIKRNTLDNKVNYKKLY